MVRDETCHEGKFLFLGSAQEVTCFTVNVGLVVIPLAHELSSLEISESVTTEVGPSTR